MFYGEKALALVAKSLGLMRLAAERRVPVVDHEGNTVGTASVDYVWVVRVMSWWYGPVTIAYAHCKRFPDVNHVRENVLFGVLLVPKNYLKLEFLGQQPFRSVEIPIHEDSVIKALHTVNLFEPQSDHIPGNIPSPRLDLIISTPNGNREISYTGGIMLDPTWINIREAIFNEILLLRSLYNDPEIEAFFKQSIVISSD